MGLDDGGTTRASRSRTLGTARGPAISNNSHYEPLAAAAPSSSASSFPERRDGRGAEDTTATARLVVPLVSSGAKGEEDERTRAVDGSGDLKITGISWVDARI